MPPSSTRLGPGPQGQRTGSLLQIHPRVRPPGRALACLLAVVLPAAGPHTPAAAADLERFLTHAGPPGAGGDMSTGTGLSGQTDPDPAGSTGPSGQVSADPPAAGATGPSGQPGPAGPADEAPPGPDDVPPPADPPARERDPEPIGARLGPGGELRVFGGMHQPTFGFALAFDWAFRRAALGVEVDYAAWLSLDQLAMHPGAIHLAALGLHRIPLGRLSLRQRLALGPAILLADLGPHRAGRTGLFFEAAPLGLEVHTRITRVTFVLDAFSLALSAPALGPELAAQFQYRATIGLRF